MQRHSPKTRDAYGEEVAAQMREDQNGEWIPRLPAERRIAELELANEGLRAVIKACQCPSCVALREANTSLMESVTK